jgi:Bacterial protein of unknown function (DUF899)
VSFATFCQRRYEESSRYRDFMGWTVPCYSVPQDSVDRLVADRYFGILVCYLRDGDKVYETYWTTGRGNEVMAPSYGLLGLTVYGRQEFWEDSPEGWPQYWGSKAWPVPAGRPPDRPVVPDPGRAQRRPQRDVRRPFRAALSLRSDDALGGTHSAVVKVAGTVVRACACVRAALPNFPRLLQSPATTHGPRRSTSDQPTVTNVLAGYTP